MQKKTIFQAIFFIAILNTSIFGDLILVASKQSSISSIHKNKLRNIYLGIEKFVNGKKVFLTDNTPLHHQFLKLYIRKSPQKYKAIWRMKMFTGKAMMPRSFASYADIMAYLVKNPQALGYIEEVNLSKELKKISIIK